MTPEEYERFKNAEKEHLKKLKELKKAVRVLERQKKIQSALNTMSSSSSEALDTQKELVYRLAEETALRQARMDVALDSASEPSDPTPDLDDELRRERARQLVERLRADDEEPTPSRPRASSPTSTEPERREAAENPTPDRTSRPEKTIGRM